MQSSQFLSIALHRIAVFGHIRKFNCKPESIVVAAATRTPWGKFQGQLASANAWQLGQAAVEAAVKQSAIPVDEIHHIFMNEAPKIQKSSDKFSSFLKKSKYTSISIADNVSKVESFLKAFETLKCEQQVAVVVAGLESATKSNYNGKKLENIIWGTDLNAVQLTILEDYVAKSVSRYLESKTTGIFDFEIFPLPVEMKDGKKRIIKEITDDEICPENYVEENVPFHNGDGAAAVVLTTFANAQKLKLSPLAVIKGFEYSRHSSKILHCSRKCVQKLFAKIKINPHEIKHWEIEDFFPQIVALFKFHFDLNLDLINPHGGSLLYGCSSATSLTRLLTHLTHSLNSSEYGCLICSSSEESLALVLQKLPFTTNPERLSIVTVFTKDSCSLCDNLVEELELHFSGEYELKKVFVDTKDNFRFLRLYRCDIPVVFLNNQFLCMHRLNHKLLRKRLDIIRRQ